MQFKQTLSSVPSSSLPFAGNAMIQGDPATRSFGICFLVTLAIVTIGVGIGIGVGNLAHYRYYKPYTAVTTSASVATTTSRSVATTTSRSAPTTLPPTDGDTSPTDGDTSPTDGDTSPTDRDTSPTDGGSSPTDEGSPTIPQEPSSERSLLKKILQRRQSSRKIDEFLALINQSPNNIHDRH